MLAISGTAALLLASGVIFAVLKKVDAHSVWMFGKTSSEILPFLLPISFLCTLLPLSVILAIENTKYRKLCLIVIPILTVASASWLIASVTAIKPYVYTLNTSPEGNFTIVVAEPMNDGDGVKFYQLFEDGFTMKLMSVSESVAKGVTPFKKGHASIEWNAYAFMVTYTDPETGDTTREMYTCMPDG